MAEEILTSIYVAQLLRARLQLSLDNGVRRVLVPTANKKHALDLEGERLELAKSYNDPRGAIDKSVGAS